MDVVISEHARFEMERRHIDEGRMLEVAQAPEQVIAASKGRLIHQSRYFDAVEGKEMLLRLILELREDSLHLVTVYKTSRIEKYWRMEAGS